MTALPEPVLAALADARADGFAYPAVGCRALGDERHALYLVDVECPHPEREGETELHVYVVAADSHDDGGRPRLHHLSNAVHILQNVGPVEQWRIGGRRPR